MHTLEKDPVLEEALNRAEYDKRCTTSLGNTQSHKFNRRVRNGYLVSPAPSFYARSAYWKTLTPRDKQLHVIRTLHLRHPDWIFSYASAALIHGFDVPYKLLSPIHLVTTVHSHSHNSGLIRRHFMHENLPEELTSVGEIPTTSLIRTVFDCARFYSFEDSLGIIDSALRNTSLTVEELLSFCNTKKRFHGYQQALVAVSYGNGLSENGGESFARARMINMGFVVPQLQKEFIDRVSFRRYRTDYSWPIENGITLVGEFHGKTKYLEPDMTKGKSVAQIISAETKRRNHLSASHIEVLDFDYSDVLDWKFFFHLLIAFNVPRRTESQIGKPEFNRLLLS